MIKKIKKILSITMAWVLIFTNAQIYAYAEQDYGDKDNLIPENTVLNYREMDNLSKSFSSEKSEIMPVKGILPSSYSASYYIPEEFTVEQKEDHNSPVKNQNPYGTCWAHAAMSMAESSYIINEGTESNGLNLNEYHLVHHAYGAPADSINLFGGDYIANPNKDINILQQGGHNSISLCVLANWQGASDARVDVYGDSHVLNGDSPESILGYQDAAHMENAYIIAMPDMTSDSYLTDMNVVKKMIMNYGSVGISYYAAGESDYFLASHQYVNKSLDTNHAVTIVGWNDNISKEAFAIEAPGDGAWLVKNSWGESWGADGYFWLSYYDKTIDEDCFVFDFVQGDNYDNNYQYDGSGYLYGAISGSRVGQVCAANTYIADSNEALEAVGFYTRDLNVQYEIRVYRDLEDDALPNTGKLVLTQTGVEEYIGYHTVKLDEIVPLSKDERYSVVITLKKDGEHVGFAVDKSYDYSWVEFRSYAKAGESYGGYSVDTLADLNPTNTEHSEGRNARIKAFTNERNANEDIKINEMTMNISEVELEYGDSAQLSVSISPSNATNIDVNWTTSNEAVATVDNNGKVTAMSYGSAIITATARDGSDVSTSCVVTVNPVLAEEIEITWSGNAIELMEVVGIGKEYTLSVNYYPINTTIKEVSWTSSNENVATVNEYGVVNTLGTGSTLITATTKDGSNISASCYLFVSPIVAQSINITLDGNVIQKLETNLIGKIYEFDVNILPIDAMYAGVLWESSNIDVASVDSNGVVTIKGVGNATISAWTYGESYVIASCNIVVNNPIKEDDKNNTKEPVKEEDKGNTKEPVKEDEQNNVSNNGLIAPKISIIENVSAGIKLKWNKVPDATGYVIYRKNYENGAWKKVANITDGNKLTYTDKSTKNKNGNVYKYKICAVNEANISDYSGDVTIARLTTVSLKRIKKVSKTSIICTWKKKSKVSGYRIRLTVGNKVYKTYTLKNGKTISKTIKRLAKGKKYKVQIQSYKKVKGAGTYYSLWSNGKTIKLEGK